MGDSIIPAFDRRAFIAGALAALAAASCNDDDSADPMASSTTASSPTASAPGQTASTAMSTTLAAIVPPDGDDPALPALPHGLDPAAVRRGRWPSSAR